MASINNVAGTKFVHIQVKTYIPGKSTTCSVGLKAEKPYGDNFFWVLGGIREPEDEQPNEFYVVPASVMSSRIQAAHQNWLETPGKDGRPHKDSSVRTVHIPPASNQYSWDISPYKNAWHLIEEKLADQGCRAAIGSNRVEESGRGSSAELPAPPSRHEVEGRL